MPRFSHLLRHTIDVGLALAILAALSPWLGRRSASVDLLAHFLIQLTLATGLLFLGLLLARRWRRACVAMLCLALQLVTLDPRPGGSAVAAVPRARILALNVWIENREQGSVIDHVRRSGADVVVLGEVIGAWPGWLDGLSDLYPERVDCLDRPGCDVVILSRRPVDASRELRDDATHTPYVEARLSIDGRPLTVAGTHLMRPIGDGTPWRQQKQMRFIADRLAEVSGPRLLVGDLNAVGWGRVVHDFTLRSGFRALPTLEGTWPAQFPGPLRIPIDQALVSPEIENAIRRTGPFVGSDHLPLMVELGLPSGG